MEYTNQMKELREDCDLSQSEVAKILNCSQTCYSKYELGQREIPIRTLCKLADYYGVTTDYILGRTSTKKTRRNKTKV